MDCIIREAEIQDMVNVLALIKELANFENEPDAVVIDKSDLIKHGFSEKPLFKIFVAELKEEIVGMVLFYPRYSTWKGETLHLEDLIVKQEKRSLGIGKALYTRFLEYAYEQKVKRVEWVVLDWNKNAIEFYKKTGANILKDWRTVQMHEKALNEFITSKK